MQTLFKLSSKLQVQIFFPKSHCGHYENSYIGIDKTETVVFHVTGLLWRSAAYVDQIIVRALFRTTIKCKRRKLKQKRTQNCAVSHLQNM